MISYRLFAKDLDAGKRFFSMVLILFLTKESIVFGADTALETNDIQIEFSSVEEHHQKSLPFSEIFRLDLVSFFLTPKNIPLFIKQLKENRAQKKWPSIILVFEYPDGLSYSSDLFQDLIISIFQTKIQELDIRYMALTPGKLGFITKQLKKENKSFDSFYLNDVWWHPLDYPACYQVCFEFALEAQDRIQRHNIKPGMVNQKGGWSPRVNMCADSAFCLAGVFGCVGLLSFF